MDKRSRKGVIKMNRIEKLKRMRDLAEELDVLQQELAGGMDVEMSVVRDRNEILENIREDAEQTLANLEFWVPNE